MRFILKLFSIILTLQLHAETRCFLYPIGKIVSVSDNFGPYHLYDLDLDYYEIYKVCDGEHKLIYKIEKDTSKRTRNYTLKDQNTDIANHSACLFSTGSLMDCMKYFEVVGGDKKLGHIKGKFWTSFEADFTFYNEKNEILATSYLSNNWNDLTIIGAQGEVILKAKKVLRPKDLNSLWSYSKPEYFYFWDVTIFQESDDFDRFIWPFLGFIAEVWWYKSPYDFLTEVQESFDKKVIENTH